MEEPVEIIFVSPLRSGLAEIKAWARSADAEIVVHPRIVYPDEAPSGCWAVSHRRTGKAIEQYRYLPSREAALELADKIESLTDWQKITRDGEETRGLSKDEMTALAAQCRRAVSDYVDAL